MTEFPSTSSADVSCELCNRRTRLYTCPRCGVGYCSTECYKSDAHTDCSESFYKQCVEEELKSQENDPAARQKMIEILKRVHEADLEDDALGEDINEEDSPLDSDDEQELPDLGTRLENVNLDDPDELWSALSEAEKQEFEALLKNGEAEKLLPQWTPWWSHMEKKLIQPVEEDTKDSDSNLHPSLIDMPLFNELQKASPSVRFNVINVVYAYAYIALYYNGDYLNCFEDSTNVFLTICENIRGNKVFEDVESAIESVIENIESVDWLPQDEQTLTSLREAGASILQGPNAETKTIYVSASLSELHRLLTATMKEISMQKRANSNREFTRKFSQRCNGTNLSKKTILLYLKKLEYYLSWVKSRGTEIM